MTELQPMPQAFVDEALAIFRDNHNMDIVPDTLLLAVYETRETGLVLEARIRTVLRGYHAAQQPDKPIRPAKKPFQICIKLELYYDLPAENFPDWATEEGAVQMVEAAFDNCPHNNLPSAFSKDGILQRNPTEIAIGSITSA